jgi:hypothetical protein
MVGSGANVPTTQRTIEGSTKRLFFAVLHMARINSPVEAVRAAIVAENRKK